jgi:hypothetical protein
MAIETSDLLWKLSVKTGAAGNATAQADPNASLGKYISTTAWAGGTLHDLFDVITGDENAASTVDYRCVFLHNNHATLTLTAAKVWVSSQVAGGAGAAIGLDTTAASEIGATDAQALEVANETTAPSGVSFSTPTTKGDGLTLGDIGPGECRAVWFRRTAADSVAVNDDGFTVNIEGDTEA